METSAVPWLALKGVAVWLLILGLAFSNAALRELVLIPRLGKTQGLAASGVILCLLVVATAYVCLPWLGARGTIELMSVGALWLVLTAGFDLAMGWAQGKPARQLFDAYLFKDGNLWPLVLMITVAAPYLAARARGWI